MNRQELGQLAYRVLIERAYQRGVKLGARVNGETNDSSMDLGIPFEEGKLFSRRFFQDLLCKVFPGVTIQDSVSLSMERRAELSLMMLSHKIEKEPINLTPGMRREVTKFAKSMGEDPAALMELYELIVRELVERTFAKS